MEIEINIESDDEWTYPIINQTSNKVDEAKDLLGEALDFMNMVPNNKYGDHYKLCTKIARFLKR